MGVGFSVLHLADLYLGWTPPGLEPSKAAERRQRRDDVLRRAVDLAVQRKDSVRLVVIAGNLFTTHKPDVSLVQLVLEQLRRLVTAGIAVVTVPGRHDELTYAESVYRRYGEVWPGVLVRTPTLETVARLRFANTVVCVDALTCLGGVTKASDYQVALEHPEGAVRILVLHAGLMGEPARSRLPQIDPQALVAAGYHYVALGSGGALLREGLGSTMIARPGQVEGRDFDEPGCGVFTVAQWDGQGFEVVSEALVVQSVASVDLDVSQAEDAQGIEALLAGRAGRDTLLRLRLVGSRGFALDLARLLEAYRERYFHLELVDDSEALTREALGRWKQEPTVLGEFVRRMGALHQQAPDEASQEIIEQALERGVRALRGGTTHE